MAYSAKEGVSPLVSLATDQEGDAIDVRNQSGGSIQIVWAAAGATDAVVKIQESHDKTNWKDMTGKSVTIAAATGHDIILLPDTVLLSPYIRIVIVDNSENAGTCVLRYFFKGAY